MELLAIPTGNIFADYSMIVAIAAELDSKDCLFVVYCILTASSASWLLSWHLLIQYLYNDGLGYVASTQVYRTWGVPCYPVAVGAVSVGAVFAAISNSDRH